MAPLISVIIPVYNVERYLCRCLDSVINQTYKDLEIICINDGSPDNSASILEQYAAKDTRIRVITQKNGGISSARNSGMDVATGEFIAFVDSDDSLELHCYERCMDAFEDDVDVVCFNWMNVHKDGTRKKRTTKLKEKFTFSEGILFRQPWNVWAKVFRASALDKYSLRFAKEKFAEDLAFYSCFFLVHRPTVRYLDEPLYHYYQNESSLTAHAHAKKDGYALQLLVALDSVHTFLTKHNKLVCNKKDFFQLCRYCFEKAVMDAPQHEHAACYSTMTAQLRRYDIDYSADPSLEALAQGAYEIIPNKDINDGQMKRFRRIFSIKKEGPQRVVRLFSKRLFSFNRNGMWIPFR